MLKCDIRITFPDGDKVLCGTILCQDPDPRGWIEGAFRYAFGYLDDPRAFPLDPEVLPLSNREFQAKRSTGVHAVFEDCLPDDWGRRLLVRKANLERTRQSVPHLSQPEVDVPMLFRQMVFNALIGNTDDHLKNFVMLHGGNGFFLSPAYDLLPDTAQRREHVLHFDAGHLFPGFEHLVHIGKKAGVKKPAEIASQIRDVIRRWRVSMRYLEFQSKKSNSFPMELKNALSHKRSPFPVYCRLA